MGNWKLSHGSLRPGGGPIFRTAALDPSPEKATLWTLRSRSKRAVECWTLNWRVSSRLTNRNNCLTYLYLYYIYICNYIYIYILCFWKEGFTSHHYGLILRIILGNGWAVQNSAILHNDTIRIPIDRIILGWLSNSTVAKSCTTKRMLETL